MSEKTPDLDQAYNLQTPDDSKRLYAEWATDYDTNFIQDHGYVLPLHVARLFAEHGGQGPVLDIGAGTGACGAALQKAGVSPLDATDISPEMLAVAAEKGIYRDLFDADILAGLPVGNGHYSGVVSSGTFTTGHVGPDALDEVLRVTQPGGLVAISINAKHYESAGFSDKLDSIKAKTSQITLPSVRIYDASATGPNKDDIAYVALIVRD